MKSKKEKLLDKVRAAHDLEAGQTWGHGGTCLTQKSVCSICGMQAKWLSDSQNDIENRWTFHTIHGDPLPLIACTSCPPKRHYQEEE